MSEHVVVFFHLSNFNTTSRYQTTYYISPELIRLEIGPLVTRMSHLRALCPQAPHEENTHAERSIFIKNGRIPPLPRGHSTMLSSVIKAIANLNLAVRPSAAQLLQHELLALTTKVVEAEKMPSTVKTRKSRNLCKGDRAGRTRSKAHYPSGRKDAGTLRLHNFVLVAQSQFDARKREAIGKGSEELCMATLRREEAAAAVARREDEIYGNASKRSRPIWRRSRADWMKWSESRAACPDDGATRSRMR
ncbi:hypothetical protein OG21DRAFT_829959 [Imleria badia]|nr:hypothetical protein OG21DRAFT_829959 [Imleria badia]